MENEGRAKRKQDFIKSHFLFPRMFLETCCGNRIHWVIFFGVFLQLHKRNKKIERFQILINKIKINKKNNYIN